MRRRDGKEPKAIRYRGATYRLAQDEEPEVPEFMEEPAEPEKPGKFSFKTYDPGQEGITAMARLLVAGLAAKMTADGIDKAALKGAKPSEAVAQLAGWLKRVAAERGVVKEELRLLQRYGPQQYLAKKGQQLRSIG